MWHVCLMIACQKRILFGWLPQKRPAHGVRLRWRDKVRQDFKSLSINDSLWYQQTQDRSLWKQLSYAGMENLLTVPRSHHSFHCPTCPRSFRRSQDIARHKCVTTRPRRGRHWLELLCEFFNQDIILWMAPLPRSKVQGTYLPSYSSVVVLQARYVCSYYTIGVPMPNN